MRTLHLILLAVALGVAANSVLGRGQERPGEEKRYCQAHLQANLDRIRTNFQTLDADHNGVLTQKESGLKQEAAGACFRRLDRDHDHTLSPDELVRG